MTDFLSRDGKPMELMEWATAYEDEAIRRVAYDKVGINTIVSTIWEGIVGLRDGIFDSVIVVNGHVTDSIRSNTEEEALAAHQTLLRRVKGEE